MRTRVAGRGDKDVRDEEGRGPADDGKEGQEAGRHHRGSPLGLSHILRCPSLPALLLPQPLASPHPISGISTPTLRKSLFVS